MLKVSLALLLEIIWYFLNTQSFSSVYSQDLKAQKT